MISTYLSATTLNEFVPYNMYDTPREEIEDFYNFAVENNIPTAGITTLDQMHVLARGVKKLFRIYKEEIGGHTFYHAFYTTRRHGLARENDPYFRDDITEDDITCARMIDPWVDNLYEFMDDKPEFGKIEDNPYPMIYQRLYLETGNGLKYLDEAEYFLSFNRPGPTTIGIEIGSLQPWSLEDEFGYWSVLYIKSKQLGMYDSVSYGQSHRAKRVYLDEEGENIGQIDIEASNPLIDSQRPFRYLILNAFDQNPATSYVEDTEDDLMDFVGLYSDSLQVYLHNKKTELIGLRLVNGFAKNQRLYFENNIITKIGSNILKKTIDYQFIKYPAPQMSIGIGFGATEISKGTKFNDTCLAEIDWQLTDGSYLIGGRFE